MLDCRELLCEFTTCECSRTRCPSWLSIMSPPHNTICHVKAFDPATITICRYNFPGDVTMLLYGLPTAKGWSRVIMGFASPAVGGGWVCHQRIVCHQQPSKHSLVTARVPNQATERTHNHCLVTWPGGKLANQCPARFNSYNDRGSSIE